MGYETVENEKQDFHDENEPLWEPEVMDEAHEGIYNEKEEGIGMKGTSNMYHFSPAGNIKTNWKVWGSSMLDNLMANPKINIGDRLMLVYKGKRQGKNGMYKVWEVKRWTEGGDETPSPPVAPANIPKQEIEVEGGAIFQEAKGYINDAYGTLAGKGNQEPTIEDLKDELLDMYGNHDLTSDFGFSQKAIFNTALKVLESMRGADEQGG